MTNFTEIIEELKVLTSDIEKIKFLNKKTEELLHKDIKTAELINNESLRLAEQIDDIDLKAQTLCYQSRIIFSNSDTEKAYKNTLEILNLIDDESKYPKASIDVHNMLGRIYMQLGDYLSAVKEYNKSLKLSELTQSIKSKAVILNNIGLCCRFVRDYDQAAKYLKSSLKFYEEAGDESGKITAFLNLGIVYQEKKEIHKAEEYLKFSLKAAEDGNFKRLQGFALNSLGVLYKIKQDYDKALEYYQKSLEIKKELNDEEALITSYANIAKIYIVKEKWAEAEEYLLKALSFAEKRKSKFFICHMNYELAIIYKEKKDFEKAFKCLEKYSDLNNEIFKEQSDEKMKKLHLQYDIDSLKNESDIIKEKNKELKALNSRLNFTAKELETQKKELENNQKELEKINAAKDRFFSIIAHDLKNPFTVLIGISELLKKHYDIYSDERRKEYISLFHESAQRMLNLFENLLQWSRTKTGSIRYLPGSINLYEAVESALSLVKINASEKDISIIVEMPDNLYCYADKNMVTSVIRNLISNGIKFTEGGGSVTVTAFEEGDSCRVSVIDTGIGMSEDELSKIFRIDSNFSRKGTANEKGTGIGLLLCKEFIEKNGGELTVESKVGFGSSFTFSLPTHRT